MTLICFALPTIEQVKFTVMVIESNIPIRGNAMASGDDEVDRRHENMIKTQLRYGNTWAWCDVEVIAEYKGIKGKDHLGACSYKSEEDFKKGGYYADMCSNAYDDLIKKLSSLQD